MNEKPAVNKIHISAGFGGSPAADSRFAVPCPILMDYANIF